MDTEKYCSPVSTQLFLDLSSIESKDGQRDTYNDFLNIYGKLCAILNKQENKRKVLLEANDLLAGEMYQENKDFIDKYFQ